jgi:hypothetical protein
MKYLIVFVILISIACSNIRDTSLQKIPDIPESLDSLFDVETSLMKSEDALGNISIDTVRREIPKVRKIFRKGITYTYSADYLDSRGKMICSGEVKLIPTGRRIGFDPDMQDLVLIEYSLDEKDKRFLLDKQERINRSYPLESNWLDKSGEGIIENTERVWMHPIRNNQYIFTEINGFPDAHLPLAEGKEWVSNLSINSDWGDWNGLELESEYKVEGKEIVKLDIGPVKSWIINVETSSDLGTSKAKFNFNDSLGFIKMDYTNFKGERLIFSMINISEESQK